jgi:hypothetical protein
MQKAQLLMVSVFLHVYLNGKCVFPNLANKRLMWYSWSFMYLQGKKSMGIKSGKPAAHGTGPLVSIHFAGITNY